MSETNPQQEAYKENPEEQIELQPSGLSREEIVPVDSKNRSLRWLSFAAIWFTMTAQMGIFKLGASLAETMPTEQAILAVIISNLAMLLVLVPIGDIGVEHGINFAGYLRIPFGLRGSYLPLALRGFAAIAWFGIQTYYGATAIDEVSKTFFDFSAMPAWYIGFGVLQIAIVAGGINTIKKVVNFAAPALAVLSVWLLYLMFSQGSFQKFFNNEVTNKEPFIVAIVSNLSFWATIAINLPDFTRNLEGKKNKGFFKRNRHSIVAQLIGVPIGMLFFTTVGMAGFVFTGESNPILAISSLIGGTFLILALGVVILAQLSTNITANLFGSAYAANAIGAPKISYRMGAIITGIMGLLTFPWVLLDLFLTYLPALGAALAPVAGIMISDYYLIRKRRLNIPDIFKPKSQYHYWHGINPASFLAWLFGAVGGLFWLDYSFILALPVSFVLYYPLMRFWILKRYKQKELEKGEGKFLATSLGRDWPIRMVKQDEKSKENSNPEKRK